VAVILNALRASSGGMRPNEPRSAA
jgi:hypothetical protein